MALHTVPVFPPSSQDDNPTYTGTLIRDLTELVDKIEQQHSTPVDDDEETEPELGSAPLTIDDVLERSGYLGSRNPYVLLLERAIL